MSDKVQLIKEEIERRLMFFSNEYDETRILSELLQFIDSLPEENHFEDKSEMVSEDLEEAALKYRWEHPFCDGYTAYSFKAGAEWQKQQMMKDAVEGTVKYEIGSAEIPQCDKRYQVLSDPTPIANAKLGDKVKIIICKPEQQ